MAADLLGFTQSNMSMNPFLFEVSSTNGSGTTGFELSDYMIEDLSPQFVEGSSSNGFINNVMKCEREVKRVKMDEGCRIGFRMKSEVEILDDGFKWRKYGKKSVKNSPNPRNYYRCSNEGCGVKKRVERDREDNRYVITTYDGVHNHPIPGSICCNFGAHHQGDAFGLVSFGFGREQMPLIAPNPWSTVHSANSSC